MGKVQSEGMLLLIDKPKGKSSFAVIQSVRRTYGIKKVGHAGTLDPLASGLLLVGVGPVTKQLGRYVGLTKVYEAEVCIGEKSLTGDAQGPFYENVSVGTLSEEEVARVLQNMCGVLRLPVSLYSAMKRGGEPLYKKVRRGETPIAPIRDMEVLDATLVSGVIQKRDKVHLSVRFTVGSGTYVRSLAEELGRRLGYPARIENLRRTQVGNFLVEDALPM